MITEKTQIDSINTAESRGEQTIALQAWLVATYPTTFSQDTPSPLKIGIHLDLLARHPDIDPATLKRALKRYCERRAYQLALARDGAARLDLDGNPAGEVAEDQRRFAKAKLTAWKAKKPAKSAAQATPDPAPVPTPAPTPPPPRALSGRPILRLKPKAGAVVTAATVTRRTEVQP